MKHLPAEQTFDSTRKNFRITYCSVCDKYSATTQSYGNFLSCPGCRKFPELVAVASKRTHYNAKFIQDISISSLYHTLHSADRIAYKMGITLSSRPFTDFPDPFKDFPEQFIEL